jgi:hypothetical protein
LINDGIAKVMSRFENGNLRRMLTTGAALFLTTVTLAACGSDSGNEAIGPCSEADGIAYLNPAWQLDNIEEARDAIQGAIIDVQQHMPDPREDDVSQSYVTSVDPDYLPLAHAVFTSDGIWFDTSLESNKLDDKSEEFCYDDFDKSDVYYTPRAEAVIQGLVRRGYRIETGTYSRSWDHLIASIAQGNEEKLADFAH